MATTQSWVAFIWQTLSNLADAQFSRVDRIILPLHIYYTNFNWFQYWLDFHFISFTAKISERTFPSNLPNLMFTFYSNFLIWFALLAWLRGWVVGLKWQNFTKKVVLCPFLKNRTNMVTLSSMPRAKMSLKMLSWLSSYRFEL